MHLFYYPIADSYWLVAGVAAALLAIVVLVGPGRDRVSLGRRLDAGPDSLRHYPPGRAGNAAADVGLHGNPQGKGHLGAADRPVAEHAGPRQPQQQDPLGFAAGDAGRFRARAPQPGPRLRDQGLHLRCRDPSPGSERRKARPAGQPDRPTDGHRRGPGRRAQPGERQAAAGNRHSHRRPAASHRPPRRIGPGHRRQVAAPGLSGLPRGVRAVARAGRRPGRGRRRLPAAGRRVRQDRNGDPWRDQDQRLRQPADPRARAHGDARGQDGSHRPEGRSRPRPTASCCRSISPIRRKRRANSS